MESKGTSPSRCNDEGKKWILCGLERSEDRLDEYIEENNVERSYPQDKVESKNYDNEKVKKIDKRAIDDGYLSGKWEVKIDTKRIDDIWEIITKMVDENDIWGAQVTTNWIRQEKSIDPHMVRVYTPNYLDKNDVIRVGELVKKRCDIEKKIRYKPDIYNILQVYSDEGEINKLPKEIRYEL